MENAYDLIKRFMPKCKKPPKDSRLLAKEAAKEAKRKERFRIKNQLKLDAYGQPKRQPQCVPVVTWPDGKMLVTWSNCLSNELFGKPCKNKLGCCQVRNERMKDYEDAKRKEEGCTTVCQGPIGQPKGQT